ncbi:hypothetical protein J4E81_003198 [Alternaria sp. BMP 2799]|nr:hypothetical protein J4E81_003198 [Alternaria sp. BMP 2799]
MVVNPLLTQPMSYEPIETRLAAMRAALSEGFFPNELDKRPRGVGRPLDCAIEDGWPADFTHLKQNLPIVHLLLEAGADPRLPSRDPPGRSPIDSLEAWFKQYEIRGHEFGAEHLELKPFFEKALEAMKKVADELNAQDAAEAAEAARKARRERPLFGRLKFW